MTAFPLVRGRMLRATKLDGCGNVKLGPASKVVTEGFITVGLTAQTEEGETITQTNAAGKLCINDEATPQFTGWAIEITFCEVAPELFTLLTGQALVMNAAGDEAVGFVVDSDVDVSKSGFGLELWSGVPIDACEDETEAEYGYLLVPFSKGGTIGDLTVENGAVNFVLTGAKSKNGSGWGAGPYDVTRDETNAPGPLNLPVSSKRHLHVEKVTVAPPDPTDGAEAVGVPATGANATTSTPAALTPANSYPPADLAAAATGFTATPSTAWASGKYVVLGDGSFAHWNGTAWVAGIA